MDALYYVVIIVFVLVCLMLVGIILMQSSQSGGMGSMLGGNALNTAFGGQGADKLLVRITSGLAVSFMGLAIIIGMMDNPASRIDFSNEPTLNRNKATSDVLPDIPAELQTIDQSLPAVEVPFQKDRKEDTE